MTVAARRRSTYARLHEAEQRVLTDSVHREGVPAVMDGAPWMAGLHSAMAVLTREGFARAYLEIAGRWEDHVVTALITPTTRTDARLWPIRIDTARG